MIKDSDKIIFKVAKDTTFTYRKVSVTLWAQRKFSGSDQWDYMWTNKQVQARCCYSALSERLMICGITEEHHYLYKTSPGILISL